MIELLMAGALFLAPQCEEIPTPAVGTPTIEVENPEYVEAWTETIEHEAIGDPTVEVIDTPEQVIVHEEVTKTEWKYTKLRHNGEVWLDNNDQKRVWINGWEYERTRKTRTIVLEKGWTEVIPATFKTVPNPKYKEAWTETVEHAAVGTPKVTVENPKYVPESTRVECPEFDWNWQYAAPTCDGFTVTYPAFMPEGNNNLDVNVKVKNLVTGEFATFNFHDSDRVVAGQTIPFDVTSHPAWPGWEFYSFVWTQVHSTNYHWEGSVVCGQEPVDPEPTEPTEEPSPDPEPTEDPEPTVPEQPDPWIVADKTYDCDAGTMTVVEYTFGWVWDGDMWVTDEGQITNEYTAPIEDEAVCGTPAVVETEEPVTTEAKPETPKEATEPKPVVKEVAVKPVGEELAETGASIKGLVIVAALFISAGTALVVERRRRGVPPRDVPRV